MTLKVTLKNLVATFCHIGGVFNLLSFYRRRNKAFVLTYHRVIRLLLEESVYVQPGMYVTADTFRRQIAFLKERFHVLPLAELVARVETGRKVAGCCAITFDDGWHDNFTQAFPVFQEFQLPATVFLATGFIGTDRLFWPEEICFYLQQVGMRASTRQSQVFERFLNEVAYNSGEEAFLDNAVLTLKGWSPHEREKVLEHLRSAGTTPPPGRLLMNWEEAEEMQASGLITFGAHTVNHVILDQVPKRQAEEEIVHSRQELESRLGVRPEFFAYPNGNFNSNLQAILKRHGFRGAVTTRKGRFGEGVPLFEIPRIGVHEDISRTIPLFLARIFLDRF